jgi:hypothetical protein
MIVGALSRSFTPKAAVWLIGLLSVRAIVGVGLWLVQHGKNIGYGDWAEANQKLDQTTLEAVQRMDAATAREDTRYRELLREIGE